MKTELLGYDRSSLSVGIVHFGVGNFHRAHQAMYLDSLARLGLAEGWGICGVGVLPSDQPTLASLRRQAGTYTLIEQTDSGSRRATRIGSITEILYAPDDLDKVLARLADPGTQIVSLTITEGGYNVSETTGEFLEPTGAIARDALPGARPQTVFGIVVAGLALRRARGLPAFAIMSCDNLEDNGAVARRSFVGFARLIDSDLADWIAVNVHFPNSMVDRITPTVPPTLADLVLREFGVEDAAPVLTEPFTQWVIEDFGPDRPQWERVGAQLVPDVRPYEQMKLRMLNASHQALAYFGLLRGRAYVHEAASDPQIVAAIDRYFDEAERTLGPTPDIRLGDYRRSLFERYRNQYLPDTLARLAVDGSDRVSKFVLPVIRALDATDTPCPSSIAVVAAWARYCELALNGVGPLPFTDRRRDEIERAVSHLPLAPSAFLRNTTIFGDLADRAAFVDEFAAAYSRLARETPN